MKFQKSSIRSLRISFKNTKNLRGNYPLKNKYMRVISYIIHKIKKKIVVLGEEVEG